AYYCCSYTTRSTFLF
nr:immunoglobulin light chain junction region [Macaca mulatta]MOY16121.1 immunoglobulin light chain junction region [Macaca mulatta]MOY16560.1 immunoglobulin light chain junction region [Macaca mulatta]